MNPKAWVDSVIDNKLNFLKEKNIYGADGAGIPALLGGMRSMQVVVPKCSRRMMFLFGVCVPGHEDIYAPGRMDDCRG